MWRQGLIATVLIVGNPEEGLATRSSIFEHLSSKSCDAKQVVRQLTETLQLDQASLEQPDPDTRKRIQSLVKEARRCDRLDVVEYLRNITPAGTTGECVSVLHIVLHIYRVSYI